MLVICNGMIRSGSTLQYNLVRNLLENLEFGMGHGYFDLEQKIISDEQLLQWGRDSCYHVIKMHEIHPKSLEMMTNRLLKICYIYRDIRDVAVSIKNMWSLEEDVLHSELDKAVEIYYNLVKIPNVLYQKYEDVISDLPHVVRELADYLDLNPTEEIIKAVEKSSSLENMMRISQSKGLQLKGQLLVFMKLHTPSKLKFLLREILGSRIVDFYHDQHTLLHPQHISKYSGATGVWRTSLDKHEINAITARYEAWLRASGYPLE